MRPTILVACLAALVTATAARADTHEQLTAIAQDMIRATVDGDPIRATFLGIEGVDGRLPVPSEAKRASDVAHLRSWARQVDAATKSAGPTLSLVDRDDAKLLRADIAGRLDELLARQTDRKDYAAPAMGLVEIVFTQFLHLPIAGQENATASDVARAWNDIIARLSAAPAYIEAAQKLATHPGRLFGTVGARQLAGAPDFLDGALTKAAQAQLASDPAGLVRFTTARDALLATLARTRATLEAQAPNWPDNYAIGKAAYDRMLRERQLLPYDSADLERMARDELAHGWAEEAWLVSLAGQRGQALGAESGGGMAPGGPALIEYYRARLAQLRQFVEQHDVLTVPAWLGQIEVVETPKFLQPVSPGAAMEPPRLFSRSTTGYYFITPPDSLEDAAKRLDMNEDFDSDRILSTGAHEAMPGHFMQLSIARRHPDFIRKTRYDAAFAEGWAFYGEEMFVRLGLYGDDLDGRLYTARWERVRGARVIVDIRLATGEWTVDQAAVFFEAQTGFTKDASIAAVSGFALHPGYVVSYTVGRLQLETLLSDYQLRMGARGTLHDFHDRLLSYGTVPFAVVGPELLADLDKPASAVRAAANY